MIEWMKLMATTGGGAGLFPKAPGTWGSLKPLLIVLVCGHFGMPPIVLLGVLLLIIIGTSVITITLAPWYASRFGTPDPPQVVSDEAAGQSLALLGMAWLEPGDPVVPAVWISLAFLAFILFRLFDIWKPSLIDTSQRLPRGWGVLTDDLLAGFAAGAIVFAISFVAG